MDALTDLPPDYVAELHRQAAFVSAVLGGFAAAFVGALLTTDSEKQVGTWAVGFAAASSVLFIVATFGSSVVVLDVLRLGITDFDFANWPASTVSAKSKADLTYFLGIYTLIVAIGMSGWTRSRATGIVTTAVSAVGFLLLTSVVRGIL